MHQQRLTLQKEAETCRSAICYIRWIPIEILGEIFTWCLPEDHRFSPNVAPLSLCHVSKLWHDQVISTPSFWRELSFWSPKTPSHMCYPIRSPHYLNQWLLYSGTMPLDLFFDQGITACHMETLVKSVLMKQYTRCRHLELHITDESAPALVCFVGLPHGSFKVLESLVLEGLDEVDAVVSVFRESQCLRKFTTDNLDFTYTLTWDSDIPKFDHSVLPWMDLTHLMVTDFLDVHIFAATLSHCSAIQYLRVSLSLMDVYTNAPDKPSSMIVSLPNLTQMYISVHGGLCFPSAMDIFRFPALAHLRFRRSQGRELPNGHVSPQLGSGNPFSWAMSQQFLSQLRHLQQLTLVGDVGSSEQIQWVLRNTPTLTKLTLDIWVNYESLIPAMFHSINGPTLPPLLNDLELYLQRAEIPFPSHIIRDRITSTLPCLLQNLKISCQLGYPHFIRVLESQFLPFLEHLRTDFACATIRRKNFSKGWSISARHDLDRNLIVRQGSSITYTMVDVRY